MLIDGGEPDSAVTIINYIKANGAAAIDYLVATHPHSDHIGGLPAIIDALEIGSVYMPNVSHTTHVFERLLTAIQNKGLLIDPAKAGVTIFSAADLQIDIIAPVKDSYSNINDASAVVKVKYINTAFLFMGDAGLLPERHITANISADVLKIAHHGAYSSTSKAFLKRVAPSYAIISVGRDSLYGHPSDMTLSRLDELGVKVFRTDLHGAIVFTSNGSAITVETKPTALQTATPEPTSETAKAIMVWLSATGNRYHSVNDCGNMDPKRARQITLEQAKKSYKPCSSCNPPR
jgi:beta-lactamase superfamily II metal-dependent hydrolase